MKKFIFAAAILAMSATSALAHGRHGHSGIGLEFIFPIGPVYQEPVYQPQVYQPQVYQPQVYMPATQNIVVQSRTIVVRPDGTQIIYETPSTVSVAPVVPYGTPLGWSR